MAKVEIIEPEDSDSNKTRYRFMCPGCKRDHTIDDGWKFNGDKENPTFNPSIDFTGGRYDKDENYIKLHCHSFVENGNIRFLNDCSHELAGQTVELPEVE